jgi:hypothetical protein
MPIRSEYTDQGSKGEHATFLEHISAVCRNENIDFFDLQKERTNLEAIYFYKAHHVNASGAEIVSRYVADNILIPRMDNL